MPLSGANDFAYRDGIVYMGSLNAGMRVIVDITDPSNPVVGKQVPLHYGSHMHTPYGNTGIACRAIPVPSPGSLANRSPG